VEAAALLGVSPDPELTFTLAEAQYRTGALETSRLAFERVLERAIDPILEAKVLGRIAKIHEARIDADRAWTALESAFRILGIRPPTRVLTALPLAVLAWIAWMFFPSKRLAQGAEVQRLEAVLALYAQASRLAFQCTRPLTFVVVAFASLRLARRLGASPALVMSLHAYAFVLLLLGFKSAGLRQARRGALVAESLRDPVLQALVIQQKSVLLAWAGPLAGAQRILPHCVQSADP
jgi:hypothetical protein